MLKKISALAKLMDLGAYRMELDGEFSWLKSCHRFLGRRCISIPGRQVFAFDFDHCPFSCWATNTGSALGSKKRISRNWENSRQNRVRMQPRQFGHEGCRSFGRRRVQAMLSLPLSFRAKRRHAGQSFFL